MSLEKEATVRARLDGVDEVASGFQKIGQSGQTAGATIGGGFKAAGGAIKDAVQGVVSDLGHVVTAAAAINFAGAIGQAHQFEDSVNRMSVATRTSFRSMGEVVNDLSTDINELPNATAGWIQSVAKVTYGYQGAATAAKQAAEYAALTGQSVDEVQPLVVALEQMTGAAGASGHALEVLVAQARALHTVGGPKALGDMFAHLQGQISMTGDSVEKTGALLAGFGNKGNFTPQQRERALGSWMSRVEANPEGFERFLGHKITDDSGHVKDMAGTLRELQDYGRKSKGQRMRLQFTTNAEATAALMQTDFGAVASAESAAPSSEAAEALKRAKDSAAGQRKANEVKKSLAMQDTVGSGSLIGGISDWIGSQSASHPLLAGMSAAVGTKLLSKGVGAGWGALFGGGEAAAGGAAAAGGGGSLGGGVGSLLVGGLGAGGLAAGGALLGSMALAGKFFTGDLVSRGFRDDVDLTQRDARQLSAKAEAGAAGATSERSPGMQAAYDAEIERKRVRDARDSGATGDLLGGLSDYATQNFPGVAAGAKSVVGGMFPAAAHPAAGSPEATQMRAIAAELVKAGASLQLAQETAQQLMNNGGVPIQITVFNETGGKIDAMVRGEQ